MGASRELAKDFESAYWEAISVWGPWFHEAKKDIEFPLGNQWSANDKSRLRKEDRDPWVFNEVQRVVRLITGYQRQNRQALKTKPVEGSDDETARQFSGLLQNIMIQNNGYELLSDSFKMGPVITGLNLLELYLDYELDPLNGDLTLMRVPHNQALLDPYFTDRGLKDCNYLLRRKWLRQDDAKAAIPEHAKEIGKLTPQGRDDKFPDAPAATDFKGKNLLRVDEFYRRTTKKAKLLVDRLNGEFRIWTGEKKQLDDFLRQPDPVTQMNIGDRMQVLDHYQRTVQLGIMVEGLDFYNDYDLLGIDDYPFVPVLGEWVPEYTEMKYKLQGLVRCMRDPQTEKNRRRLKALDIMDSVISTGFIAEPGSVVSRDSLYQSGQSRVIWAIDGKSDRIRQLTGGDVPQGLFKMMELLDGDVLKLPGVEGLLSAPEMQNQQIAMGLAKLREAQGLTPQQDLFDNFRLAKKHLGAKMLRVIQVNWQPNKVQRLLNEKPTPEFYTRDFGKYDCVISEGQLTETQRQMYYLELKQLKADGAPISWRLILQAAPLEYKREVLVEIEKADKAQGMAAQAEMMSKQVTDKLLQAETAARIAGAQEKTAKIQTDRAQASLNMAKAMAEIEKMGVERFATLFNLVMDLDRGGGLGLAPMPQVANDNVVPLRRGQMMTRR